MKKAFTLIELLVVIAIIAILAAILFPVFAQAKAAAKGSASLSNDKQSSLGIIMYASDSDDTFPLSQSWSSSGFVYWTDANHAYEPWTHRIFPYTKNSAILRDPLGTGLYQTGLGQQYDELVSGNYGYNQMFLSPFRQRTDGTISCDSVSATAPADPAGTVMITTIPGWWSAEAPNAYMDSASYSWFNIADAPDCLEAPADLACIDNWGANGAWASVLNNNEAIGALTGGVAPRASGSMVVSYTDGHVKKVAPGNLAAGTNWAKTRNSSDLFMVDVTKYQWDLL